MTTVYILINHSTSGSVLVGGVRGGGEGGGGGGGIGEVGGEGGGGGLTASVKHFRSKFRTWSKRYHTHFTYVKYTFCLEK